MQNKSKAQQTFLSVQGMNRDKAISKNDTDSRGNPIHIFAFENMNIRITTRESDKFGGGSLDAVTNERGNLKLSFYNYNQTSKALETTATNIIGIAIGYAVINNYLTIFTTTDRTDSNKDHIYITELS